MWFRFRLFISRICIRSKEETYAFGYLLCKKIPFRSTKLQGKILSLLKIGRLLFETCDMGDLL